MQRITITLEEELLAEVDQLMTLRGYSNRSEAIRDLARAGLRQAAEETGAEGGYVGALVYVYDHAARELAKRLAMASTSITICRSPRCMFISVMRAAWRSRCLKGAGEEIRHFSDAVLAERGVRHGQLVLVPVDEEAEPHSHDGDGHRHSHLRVRQAG
ncbi:MAG: nickel-responsive transcriptional regulator NikR [Aliidongia sp.]